MEQALFGGNPVNAILRNGVSHFLAALLLGDPTPNCIVEVEVVFFQ